MWCFSVDGGGSTSFRHFVRLCKEASSCFGPTFPISFSICVFHVIFVFPLFYPSNLNYNAFRKTSPSSQNMSIPSHSVSFYHFIHGLIQPQHVHHVLSIHHFHSTHCSYHCPFNPSQDCKFFLPQTPCLASIEHYRSYTALVNSSLYQISFPKEQFSTFSKFHPAKSHSYRHCLFTSTIGILSIL